MLLPISKKYLIGACPPCYFNQMKKLLYIKYALLTSINKSFLDFNIKEKLKNKFLKIMQKLDCLD